MSNSNASKRPIAVEVAAGFERVDYTGQTAWRGCDALCGRRAVVRAGCYHLCARCWNVVPAIPEIHGLFSEACRELTQGGLLSLLRSWRGEILDLQKLGD